MEAYGLFGEKLSHSMSPAIYKILFEKYGINATYSIFEIEKKNFKDAIKSCKTLNINGVNVTIPYKMDVIEQLDEIDDSVKKIGACNCVKFNNSLAKGYNTDYYGVSEALRISNVDVKNKDCVVLGSGGASKSVVTLLKDKSCKSIKIVTRKVNDKQSDSFIEYIDYDKLKNINKSYLLVNTTPVGMSPNISNSPVGKDVISKFEVCFDAIYNPIETLFLKKAKECNVKTIDGLYMLVGQAVYTFEIYTGIKVDEKIFYDIYMEVKSLLK